MLKSIEGDIAMLLASDIDYTESMVLNNVGSHYGKQSVFKLFIKLIGHIFIQKYAFTFHGHQGKILFMNGPSTHRGNDKTTYAKIKSCAQDYDEIFTTERLHPANFLANLVAVFSYLNSVSGRGLSTVEKLYGCISAASGRALLRFLNTVGLQKYRCGVVYNELQPLDNIFVQYLKNKGILTVTCQHGAFTAPVETGKWLDAGIELTYSIADIFLAWSPMTRDEAVKSGMNTDRMRLLGIPKCIGEHVNDIHEKTGYFGVVLTVKSADKDNVKLIQIANAVAEKTGMRYYVKLHPNLAMNEYDTVIDKNLAEVLPKETTVPAFAQMVDFSIITTSTVYLELLFYKSRVYKLRADSTDKFSKFKKYDFSTEQELMSLLQSDYDADEAFYYYCYTDDPKKKYEEFFREMIEK